MIGIWLSVILQLVGFKISFYDANRYFHLSIFYSKEFLKENRHEGFNLTTEIGLSIRFLKTATFVEKLAQLSFRFGNCGLYPDGCIDILKWIGGLGSYLGGGFAPYLAIQNLKIKGLESEWHYEFGLEFFLETGYKFRFETQLLGFGLQIIPWDIHIGRVYADKPQLYLYFAWGWK